MSLGIAASFLVTGTTKAGLPRDRPEIRSTAKMWTEIFETKEQREMRGRCGGKSVIFSIFLGRKFQKTWEKENEKCRTKRENTCKIKKTAVVKE